MKSQQIYILIFLFTLLLIKPITAIAEVVNGKPYRITARELLGDKHLGFLRASSSDLGFETVLTNKAPSDVFFEDAGDGYVYINIGSIGGKKSLGVLARGIYSRTLILRDNHNQEISFRWKLVPRTPFSNPSETVFRIKSKLGGGYLSLEKKMNTTVSVLSLVHRNSATMYWRIDGTNTPLVFSVSYVDKRIGKLCPTTHIQGDREFSGNGPLVTGRVNLAIVESNTATSIVALVNFGAIETRPDRSQVTGQFIETLISNPNAWKAKKIIRPIYKLGFFEKTFGGNINYQQLTRDGVLNRAGPLKSIAIVGDTGGDDISYNADCSDATRIVGITFNTITVDYEYKPIM